MADTRACACGALATERCFDCRTVYCPRHGSSNGDFILPTLQTDLLGLIVHWKGPLTTSDGAHRCVNCLARHAHRLYSEGAARAAAALPPLPQNRLLQCCVMAAGGFALVDQRIDRTIPTFVRFVHRLFRSNKIPFNGSMITAQKGLVRTKDRPREAWSLRWDGGMLHIFEDGTWHVDAFLQLTQVPDETFADVAILAGYFTRG